MCLSSHKAVKVPQAGVPLGGWDEAVAGGSEALFAVNDFPSCYSHIVQAVWCGRLRKLFAMS